MESLYRDFRCDLDFTYKIIICVSNNTQNAILKELGSNCLYL